MKSAFTVTLPYVLGLAPGRPGEQPVLAVLERRPGATERAPVTHHLVAVHRWELSTAYPQLVETLRLDILPRRLPVPKEAIAWKLAGVDGPGAPEGKPVRIRDQTAAIVVEVTGIGRPIVDHLTRADLGPTIAPVEVAATGRLQADRWGYRVPVSDLISTVQLLFQRQRLKVARGITKAAEVVGELVRLRQAQGDDVTPASSLGMAIAVACWYGEVGSPALVEPVEEEFDVNSAEALDYERRKRRVKSLPTAPASGPLADGVV